ncbi:MAG: hypothetical protein KIS81_11915 [Maricaulaceae bacterium]|nr:hypothetical protein [Maricaulaceae bacterium]
MSARPKAVALIRPAILIGALVTLLGAALVTGRLDIGFGPVASIMTLALGVGVLLFGLLSAAAWRVVVKANEQTGEDAGETRGNG